MQDPNSLKHVYECMKCNTLYLWTEQEFNDLHPQCDICQKDKFELKKNKLLLQCQECFEYFPRRIIRMLHPPGLLHCLKKECYGVLGIRYQLTEMVGHKKEFNESEEFDDEILLSEENLPSEEKRPSELKQSAEVKIATQGKSVIPANVIPTKEFPKMTGESGLHFPEKPVKRVSLKSEPVGLPQPSKDQQTGTEEQLKPIFKIDKIPLKMSTPKIKKMDYTELPMVGELELDDIIQDLDTILPPEIPEPEKTKEEKTNDKKSEGVKPSEEMKLDKKEEHISPDQETEQNLSIPTEQIEIKQKDLQGQADQIPQMDQQPQTEQIPAEIQKDAQISPEIISPSKEIVTEPEEILQPFRFLSIDIPNLYVNYQMPQMKELFDRLVAQEPIYHLTYQDSIEICTQTLVILHSRNRIYQEESVEYTYYIGETGGDLAQLQKLFRYFTKIFPTYSQTKVVFLGNYIGHTRNDVEAFLLLLLGYILYPENIVLLRGKSEIYEKAEESGFWKRIKAMFMDAHIDPAAIGILQKFCLDIMAHFPMFHIAKMNNGTINVLSTSSGIPFDSENPANILTLPQLNDVIKWGVETENEIDIHSKTMLFATPDENLSSQLSIPRNSTQFPFGINLFRQYLQRNNLHYMVRSEPESDEAIHFFYDAFCCSIFSAQLYTIPAEKQFRGKLVRLVPGNPPYILEINDDELEIDLSGVFNIQ